MSFFITSSSLEFGQDAADTSRSRRSCSVRAGIEEELKKNRAKGQSWSQYLRAVFYECAISSSTEVAILVLVFFDVTLLVCGVQIHGFNPERFHWTSVCHCGLLAIFFLEAWGRILADVIAPKKRSTHLLKHGTGTTTNSFLSVLAEVTYARRFPLSAFVIVDTCLVMLGILGACVWGPQSCATILPSMLRIGRVGHLGPHSRAILLRPFELIFSTVCDSASVLFSAFILLVLNMLFFAVWAMGFLQPGIEENMSEDAIFRFGAQTVENCRYAFSSLLASMSTLFALSIGDQWHDIALPIIYFEPWAFVLFMLHAVIASGVVIGLVYGVLHQTLQRFHIRQVQLDEISQTTARKAVLEELELVFEEIDADSSGYITWQEFHHNRRHNEDLVAIMEKLGLEESELLIIWDIMDTSRDGKVSQDEFVKFMWKILFDEGKWSQLKTMHCAAQSNYQAEETKKYVQDIQEELLTHRRMLERILDRGTGLGHGSSAVELEKSESALKASDTVDYFDEAGTVSEFAKLGFNADELMRGVAVDKVTRYGSDEVVTFWSGGSFIDKSSDREYTMSQPCHQCDYFVSHCWNEPPEWHKHFLPNSRLQSYGYMKAVELHNVLCDKVARRLRRVTAVRNYPIEEEATILWIDKCCIPQNDKQTKAACVALLEEFMKLSDGFLVILSWQYFTRLWCVYEWACFLRTHSAASVEIGFDAFLKSDAHDTLPLYLDSIENLSVKSSQCSVKSDHEILEAKVHQYYNGITPEESFAAFEGFAKCTAICLMAKQIVLWRARGSFSDESTWLDPFRNLANKLGYSQLEKVLSRAQPAKWYSQCKKNQEAFDNVVRYWFDNDCVQYLIQERLRAVRKFPKKLRVSSDPGLASVVLDSVGCFEFVDQCAPAQGRLASCMEEDEETEFAPISEAEVMLGESFEFELEVPHLSGRPSSTPPILTPPAPSGAKSLNGDASWEDSQANNVHVT